MALTPTLAAQTPPGARPTVQELTNTTAGGNDWITYGGALNNERYSTLNQINTSNVAQLKGAWMTRLHSGLGSKYKFEADPLVVDRVMYIPTGNDDIFALNARTGQKLWEWNSDPGGTALRQGAAPEALATPTRILAFGNAWL